LYSTLWRTEDIITSDPPRSLCVRQGRHYNVHWVEEESESRTEVQQMSQRRRLGGAARTQTLVRA